MTRILAAVAGQLTSYRASFRIVRSSDARWASLGASLLLARGVLPIATLFLIKKVVDTAAALPSAGGEAFAGQLAVLLGLAAAIGILEAVCQSASQFVDEIQTLKLTDHVVGLVQKKSSTVDIQYYETSGYHESFYRAQREAPFHPPRIIKGVVDVFRSGVTLAAMAGLLLSFDPWIVLGLVSATAIGAVARIRESHKAYLRRRSYTPLDRKADYLSYLLGEVQAAKEIRLFAIGETLIAWYEGFRVQLRRMEERLAIRKATTDMVARSCEALALYAAFGYAVYQVSRGAISLGSLVMFFQAFQRCQGALHDLMSGMVVVYENNLFLTNLHDYLALPSLVPEPTDPRPFPRPIRHGIKLRGVGFRYSEDSPRYALDDIDLHINPGEIVAIVGSNGSGKTTLAKLICRYYDPTRGSIEVDGVDLRQIQIADYRSNVSAIFQDFVHFNFKVSDNIRFGDIAFGGDDRIVEACARSGADAFVRHLPQGRDTYLGRLYEDGTDLSVGEWQKIALARALMRDAPVVILDEPSSAMDAKAEREFFDRFYDSTSGKIVVLISHRLSTIRMADRIFLMEAGRIVESGTYDELTREGLKFGEMFGKQRGRSGPRGATVDPKLAATWFDTND